MMASPTASSVRYISAVSIRLAPNATPRRSGSDPPVYRQVPRPISDTIASDAPNCFICMISALRFAPNRLRYVVVAPVAPTPGVAPTRFATRPGVERSSRS